MPASDVVDVLLKRALPSSVSEVIAGTTVHLMESGAPLCKRELKDWRAVTDTEPRYGNCQLCWECLVCFGERL